MTMTRRQMLTRGAVGAGVLVAAPVRDLLPVRAAYAAPPEVFGYGGLVADPAGLVDLPEGSPTGACFDKTGRTMFVNVQSPGVTFAVTGPWTSRSRHRRA